MSNPSNLDDDSNTANQYGAYSAQPPYFAGYSSMSTLASAAHAQGQHPQPHEIHGQHTGAAFPDFDTQFSLYGNLNSQPTAQDFNDYGAASGLQAGPMVNPYGRQGFTDWYGQTMGSGMTGFLHGYQNPPEQHSTHPPVSQAPALMRNGHVQAVSSSPPQIPTAPPASAVTQQSRSASVSVPTPAPEPAPVPASNAFQDKKQKSPESPKETLKKSAVEKTSQLESKHKSKFSPELSQPQPLPLQTSSSKETTPASAAAQTPALVPAPASKAPATRTVPDSSSTKTKEDFRPKVSIPSTLQPEEYARQCIHAAYSSRLSPFALHPEEYQLLKSHINHLQVTGYLNIRNGILRLWMNNPLVSVTRGEAAGCAKDYRWFDIADVAYQWLIRKGYINYGCTEVPNASESVGNSMLARAPKRKTVVVVGAGMAGLGCARQLEGLFDQFSQHWTGNGAEIPKVIVLEGRRRIGGRIYSHPLQDQTPNTLPEGLRCTADLGAQVITGFDNGNPLSAIIRDQLALHYHPLTDNSILYDVDGSAVDKERDQRMERLYNDILERVSNFRHKSRPAHTVEGDKELIELGRDPTGEGGKLISVLENAAAPLPSTGSRPSSSSNETATQVHAAVDKLTGKAHVAPASAARLPAAEVAKKIGFQLKADVESNATLDLDSAVKSAPHPTLGSTMDDAIRQYQNLVDLTPQDLRLLNWHFANLEYANAANVNDLSLGGWDQDLDNEFDGEHAQIIGGYIQVPRAIWRYPTALDVRTRKTVRRIVYSVNGRQPAKVECEDGESFEADDVIVTVPLGILKDNSVQFEPALPEWKCGPINRLGFGTLNKVVLVFDKVFWDQDRDMFGLLRDSSTESSTDPGDYVAGRGRFYLLWNCIKSSGRPTLVALMAGDAALQTEVTNDEDLVAEVTAELGKIYGAENVPEPSEVVISRWGKDRFSRGSYSYVGSKARPDDYDAMAKAIGNLHFAGEATCGTHPATVHGAYLSGLRAASEVIESMLGPIIIPTPLVPPKSQFDMSQMVAGKKRKADESVVERARALREARLTAYDAKVTQALYEKLGERPSKPEKSGANPFLLYQKDHWQLCKAKCDETRKQATKNQDAKATRNEVRAALGQMWRDAPDEEKKPYLDKTASNKQSNSVSAAEFRAKVEEWDRAAEAFRKEYREKHPSRPSAEELRLQTEAERETGSTRAARRANGYVDMSDSSMG